MNIQTWVEYKATVKPKLIKEATDGKRSVIKPTLLALNFTHTSLERNHAQTPKIQVINFSRKHNCEMVVYHLDPRFETVEIFYK